MTTELHNSGMKTRRAVLGDAHVDRAEAAKSEFTSPFQDLIIDAAWGHVWTSDAISLRERSMLTLALLAAQGQWTEFEMHIRATKNTGASETDIRELLMHVAIYAGIPAANHGFDIAKKTIAEMADA